MELKQLEYIVAIADEQSISKAAEKLFITQSALNQQLLRLEYDLGVTLFERFHRTMIPTYAGSVYLENARKILAIKEETYKILNDISQNKRGELSISYTPEQGSLMFSEVYPHFHKLYPNFHFRLYEARVKQSELLLRQHKVSLASIAHAPNEFQPDFDYYQMAPELMVLALPKTHDLAYLAGSKSYETFPSIDLKLLEHYPFVLLSHETRMRDMIDDEFARAGFKPYVLFEASSSHTIVNTVRNQVCAGFFPQSYVDPDAPMVYFSLNFRVCWMRSIIYWKGAYLSDAEKAFMRLSRQYIMGTLPKLPVE